VRRLRPWAWWFLAVSGLSFVFGWLSYDVRGLGDFDLELPSPFDVLISVAALLLPLLWIGLFVAALVVLRRRALVLAASFPLAMFWLIVEMFPISSGCDLRGLFPCGV
jgi:hypothetical protein